MIYDRERWVNATWRFYLLFEIFVIKWCGQFNPTNFWDCKVWLCDKNYQHFDKWGSLKCLRAICSCLLSKNWYFVLFWSFTCKYILAKSGLLFIEFNKTFVFSGPKPQIISILSGWWFFFNYCCSKWLCSLLSLICNLYHFCILFVIFSMFYIHSKIHLFYILSFIMFYNIIFIK